MNIKITDTRKLSNGSKIPIVCYGTNIIPEWRNHSKKIKKYFSRIKYYLIELKKIRIKSIYKDITIKKLLQTVISYGCIMFDTSSAYGGAENALGDSLKNYQRHQKYIVTKISNKEQINMGARQALMNSLERLGVDYVDLYLIHWPQTETWIDCWKEMEQLYNEGLCKSIGVCNCNIHHLEELKKVATISPMVNQIECHPLFTQNELRDYCIKNNILIMAYTSTAKGDFRLKNCAKLEDICNKYCKSIPQIILRWHLEIGNIPIFNTSKEMHLRSNLNIFDFSLTEEEILIITSLNINSRTRYDPDNCDFDRL